MAREREPERYSGARLPLRETIHPHYGDPYKRFPEKEILQWLARNFYGSARTICKALGYKHHNWIAHHIKTLKKAGKVYIADYERTAVQGPAREVYGLKLFGEQDVPRPKPQTGSEKSTRYRQRKRALLALQRTAGQLENQS